ncbi:MAG: phosphoribosylanthranilate isomerase [Alphaproteobacteria bacterium]|nr:phosphoribosylanthranilate isomerase [Alphaproteobacteria bacterium]
MAVLVKICGLNSPEAVRAAAEADFAGFMFYARSPRNVSPEIAASLADLLSPQVQRVAVMVDPDDAFLTAALTVFRPNLLQLHGSESAERIAAIKAAFGLRVMKVLPIREAGDFAAAERYQGVADRLLFDAKPPNRPDALPGGNAESFDWTLLAGRRFSIPTMLGGGLTAANVAEAVRTSGVRAVDVSSGVEDRPGAKNPLKIKDFIRAARGL